MDYRERYGYIYTHLVFNYYPFDITQHQYVC